MSTIEEFSAQMLPDLSPFSVEWEQNTKVTKSGKSGTYEKNRIVVRNTEYSNLFAIEVPLKVYERLRMLSLRGIKLFAATTGTADVKGFRPLIISGAQVIQ